MKQKEAIEKALKKYNNGEILDVRKHGNGTSSFVFTVNADGYEFDLHPYYPTTVKHMVKLIDIELKFIKQQNVEIA